MFDEWSLEFYANSVVETQWNYVIEYEIVDMGTHLKLILHNNHGSDKMFFITQNLRTEDVALNMKSIKIYPNPTCDLVHIKSDLSIEELQLFDLQGKMLKTSLATTTLDLSALPK